MFANIPSSFWAESNSEFGGEFSHRPAPELRPRGGHIWPGAKRSGDDRGSFGAFLGERFRPELSKTFRDRTDSEDPPGNLSGEATRIAAPYGKIRTTNLLDDEEIHLVGPFPKTRDPFFGD